MTDVAPSTEEALVERVQHLTARLEEIPDLEARVIADELASAIVQLYGEGLTRVFAALEQGSDVAAIRRQLTDDGVVASLMLIHGLYPVDLETRVREALDGVRPYLDSHGGDVELLGIEAGIVRLRLEGHCKTCAASQSTLETVIEEALQEAAPDLAGLEVEGVMTPANVTERSPSAGEHTWRELEGADQIDRGQLVGASQGLLVANVAGTLLAYRDACAGCGATLATTGMLLGGTLTCSVCARSYDLPRAGRCNDEIGLQLTPVPLLRGGGAVKVALPR